MPNITNGQIIRLQDDANSAQDRDLVAICEIALSVGAAEEKWRVAGRTWTTEQARAECARILKTDDESAWMVEDEHGTAAGEGMTRAQAIAGAQAHANRQGRTWYATHQAHAPIAIEPEGAPYCAKCRDRGHRTAPGETCRCCGAVEPDTHAGPAEPLENILGAYQITLCAGEDGIPVAEQSIPIALARECVRRLQAAGAEASDAPDTDDPSRAWVYVTTTPPQH